MKTITEKQLFKMLRGSVVTLWSFVITMLLCGMGAPLVLATYSSDNPERKPAIIVFAAVFLMLVGMTVYEGRRTRSARAIIKKLKASGELEAVLSDLACEDNYVSARPSEKQSYLQNTVLGKRFVFLFTEGIILHYYELAQLMLVRELDQKVLRAVTTSGKTCVLIRDSFFSGRQVDVFLSELRRRYPACPQLED